MDVRWQHMNSAPKDGSRILVTIGESEQGPAQVDVVFWAPADRHSVEGWRAADSSPGNVVSYADPEIKCWMPMPGANTDTALESSAKPEPWAGEDAELYGSGI